MSITKEEIRKIVKEEIEKAILTYADSRITKLAMEHGAYAETKTS
jgi:hypothetical protein